MNDVKTIIISPLDWGLGHLTRCMPIIKTLLKNDHQVIVCATDIQEKFLNKEFEDDFYDRLIIEKIKGYNIKYPKNGRLMALAIIANIPKIIKMTFYEPKFIESMVNKYQADLVISDNRFFAYSKKVPSIYMTHQLRIKFPNWAIPFEFIGIAWHKYIQRKFKQVWVPDFLEFPSLGGVLSHNKNKKAHYIGPLSRFEEKVKFLIEKQFDILALISGPEPQRSLFEQELKEKLSKTDLKYAIVLGKPQEKETKLRNHKFSIYSHLDSKRLQKIIMESRLIICRSGYSSVMDLEKLSAKAIFVPTPGQTEQEYLAKLYKKQNLAPFQIQNHIDLEKAILDTKQYKGFTTNSNLNKENYLNLINELLD